MKKQIVLLSLLLCMMFAGSAMAGIVAWWPMNEGSGQIVGDVSGNGNDGILGDVASEETSDPVWVVDPDRGNVLEWEGDGGADQWVNLDAHIGSFSGLNQGSILVWIKMPADGVNVILAASDSTDASSELRFFHDPSYGGIPGLRYDIRESGDTFFQISTFPTPDPGDDTWHYVAVTVDADGAVGLYVDGVLRTTGQEVGFFSAVADIDSMSLGRNVDSGGSQWIYMGLMSDVAVFDNPLAPAAIAAIYGGLALDEVGKMVWGGVPVDNSVHVDAATVVSWAEPEDAAGATYDVYFGTDPNFPTGAISSGQSETTHDPGQLSLATTYSWRVDTIVDGTTYEGALSSFTTTGTVSDPIPADNSSNVDTYKNLAWTGDESITSYDVYFGTDPGALTLQGNVVEASFDLPALDEFADYFWRVDTKDAGGSVIAAGKVQSFTTGGLLARWAFDENDGVTAGEPVGGADGEIVDAMWVDGIIPDANGTAPGSALYFDGASQVDVGKVEYLEGLSSMTLSTWIQLDGTQPNGTRLVEHEDVFYYYMRGTRFAYENHGFSGGRVVSTTEPVSGNWYHVLVTYDGVSSEMYVNGVLEATAAGAGQGTSIYPLQIGCRRGAGGNTSHHFTGMIDDVRIYSNKFSAEGVADLYRNTYLSKYPNPSDGKENVEIDTLLSWEGGVDSATHNVYLGTSVDPNGIIAIDSAEGISGTTFDPSVELGLNITYYWQVDEVDGSGNVIKGNIWNFVTVPPKAYNPTPADEAVEVDPSIVLEWTAGAGGTYTHDVYFGTDPLALELVSPTQTETTFDPLGAEDIAWNTTYYWAIDEVEEGSAFPGDVWSFTTINPVCETPLAGDVDGDCMVTLSDLAIMANDWMKCNRVPARSCQ